MTATVQRPDSNLAEELGSPRREGDRFVAGALGMLALLLVALQAVAGTVIPPLAVTALLYVILGIAVSRTGARWLMIVAVVLPALHLVTSIPFFAAALSHPETPPSFLPDTWVGIAALTVVAGAVTALRGAGAGARRRIVATAGVAAIAAVVISLTAAAGVTSELRGADDVAVEAADTQYPERIEVPSAGAVLWVDNQDPFRHTFVVEGTDVHVELPGSSAVRVPTDLAPGEYRYYCDVPGHESMEGEIIAS